MQTLPVTSDEHCITEVGVGGGSEAAYIDTNLTDGNAAVVGNDPVYVRERRGGQAARLVAAGAASGTFQGSNSLMRLIGWSAIRSSTWRKYASGSRPLSLAVPMRL